MELAWFTSDTRPFTMNSKPKPVVALLSGMMVASLALLAADTAWSEAVGSASASHSGPKVVPALQVDSSKATIEPSGAMAG